MYSIPIRYVLLFLALVAVPVGCTSSGSADRPSEGVALSPVGAQSVGALTFRHPALGVYYLGFPELTNNSAHSVHILGFQLAYTSPNIDVREYVVHSTTQFGGAQLIAYDPAHPDAGVDWKHAAPLTARYVIPPHAHSPRFAMAKIRLTAFPPDARASGCRVIYSVDSASKRYVQQFKCEFDFGARAARPSDAGGGSSGSIDVEIINSSAGNVVIYGCSVCKSHGALLQGDPNKSAREGDGSYLGWLARKGESLTYAVRANGHLVACRPGRRVKGSIVYVITKTDRCVVLRSS